jgi:hypothetical protein
MKQMLGAAALSCSVLLIAAAAPPSSKVREARREPSMGQAEAVLATNRNSSGERKKIQKLISLAICRINPPTILH